MSCGALIFGVAYSWFLLPFKIAPGGVGGLAQIFYHLFGLPAGAVMVGLNIPLFIMAHLLIGRMFSVGSIFGLIMGALFIDLFSIQNVYRMGLFTDVLEKYNVGKEISQWAMTNDPLLAAIAGSILLGIGVGIIFRFRGTTGGSDIPVMIMKKYFNTSITMGYLMVDAFVILLVGIVFSDPNIVIWGFFSLFISSHMCDLAAEGSPNVKGAFIVSGKHEQIKLKIFEQLDRGITVLHGEGGYKGEPKKILYVAINRRQISHLRDIVKEIDPAAFVILHDVNDVMGYGFKSRALEF